MTEDDLVEQWLLSFDSLEELLEEANISDFEVVMILWKGGHIAAPVWIEDELQSGSEED